MAATPAHAHLATRARVARLQCHATAVIAAIMEQALILTATMAAMAVHAILATKARFARLQSGFHTDVVIFMVAKVAA